MCVCVRVCVGLVVRARDSDRLCWVQGSEDEREPIYMAKTSQQVDGLVRVPWQRRACVVSLILSPFSLSVPLSLSLSLCFLYSFWDKILRYVAQADLKLAGSSCSCLSSAGVTSIYDHAWVVWEISLGVWICGKRGSQSGMGTSLHSSSPSLLFLLLFYALSVCMSLYHICVWRPWRPEEGIEYRERCELPCESSERAASECC